MSSNCDDVSSQYQCVIAVDLSSSNERECGCSIYEVSWRHLSWTKFLMLCHKVSYLLLPET